MFEDGAIMGVAGVERGRIEGEAGTVAVTNPERIRGDVGAQAGVTRTADPKTAKAVIAAVSIPVMVKVRIGDFLEAQLLETIDGEVVDESEVVLLTNSIHYINAWSSQHELEKGGVLKQNKIVASARGTGVMLQELLHTFALCMKI